MRLAPPLTVAQGKRVDATDSQRGALAALGVLGQFQLYFGKEGLVIDRCCPPRCEMIVEDLVVDGASIFCRKGVATSKRPPSESQPKVATRGTSRGAAVSPFVAFGGSF